MGKFYMLDDEIFESEDELDLPVVGETKAEAIQWVKGWLEATKPFADRMQRMMSKATSPWPQAGPGEQGCPECGTLIGEQDGENRDFCPACGWEGRIEREAMKRVFKFRVTDCPEEGILATFTANLGAAIRDINYQEGLLYVWAEVDPERPLAVFDFVVVGTGHPIPEDAGKFVKTIHSPEGLVWHFYEKRRPVIEAEDLL